MENTGRWSAKSLISNPFDMSHNGVDSNTCYQIVIQVLGDSVIRLGSSTNGDNPRHNCRSK